MELNRFRPYSYTTFADILEKHIRQVNRHLIRYNFTPSEYLYKALPVQWTNFRLFATHAVLDVIVFVGLVYCSYDSTGSGYNNLIKKAYGIAEPDKISFCYLLVVISYIDAVYLTFYWTLKYRASFMQVLYYFRLTMDWEVTAPEERVKFTRMFNIASYQTGNNLKVLIAGLIFLTLTIMKTLTILYWNSQISLTSGIAMLAFYIACQIELGYIQYMMYALLCGLFFCLKIFRYKTRVCLRLSRDLADNPKENYWKLPVLWRKLIKETHQPIVYYNRQIREYNFVMDCLAKASNMWSILNLIKSDKDIFSILFCVIFGLMYVNSHFMGERVSWFQSVAIPEFNSKIHSYACRFSRLKCFRAKQDRRTWNLIRTEKLIDFCSSSGTQFGLSYGKQYMYTSYKVAENLIMFVYILLLVTKRSRQQVINEARLRY